MEKSELQMEIDTEIRRLLSRNGLTVEEYEKSKKEWSPQMVALVNSVKSSIYNERRQTLLRVSKGFWTTMMGSENFKQTLKEFGLRLTSSGDVYFDPLSDKLLRYCLNEIVIPEIEKRFSIKGLRLRSGHIGSSCKNLFDWHKVEVDENVTQTDEK